MQLVRTGIALDPRQFGRRAARTQACDEPQVSAGDDLKLFATTFAAGFLFVSVLIA
jgi:hypothetical protein